MAVRTLMFSGVNDQGVGIQVPIKLIDNEDGTWSLALVNTDGSWSGGSMGSPRSILLMGADENDDGVQVPIKVYDDPDSTAYVLTAANPDGSNIGGEGSAGSITTLNIVLDGGEEDLAVGLQADLTVDFACTIEGVKLLANASGSCVIDIWKDTYANYPPTNADSITAAAPPTLSTAVKMTDETLTGWTTEIAAGDTLRFNVDSCSGIQRITIALKVSR